MRGTRRLRRAERWGFVLSTLGLGASVASIVTVWTGFGFTRVVHDRAGHGPLIEALALVTWAGLAVFVVGAAVSAAAGRARRRESRAAPPPADRARW
jgi:hypothetical protein